MTASCLLGEFGRFYNFGGWAKLAKLDPEANRDFKGIRVGFNEYEYRILEEASRRTGRSKLNYIRHAMLTMAKQLEPN